MKKGIKIILLLFLAMPLFLSYAEELTISGYYKNILSLSKATQSKENFFTDLNRLRLKIDFKFSPSLKIILSLDNEVMLHDLYNNPDFSIIRQKNQKELAFMDGDYTSRDRKHTYIRHSLYRAYLKYKRDNIRLTLGKQNIDFSRMRFFGPLDLFNPISPLDLEQDEKIGTDALNFEYFLNGFSSLNIILAPKRNSDESKFAIRLTGKLNDYDLMFVLGELTKDEILGFGFDGYLFNAGLRAEITYTHPDDKNNFVRLAIGTDYTISTKLYLLFEYFYNGGYSRNRSLFLSSYQYSQKVRSLNRHLLNFMVKYEISPLVTFNNYLIYDIDGKSVFLNPQISYNVFTNLDVSLGAQFFWGKTDAEFGSYQNLYYTELKYFF